MAMHHNKCPKIESIRKNPPSCTASDTGEDSCPKKKKKISCIHHKRNSSQKKNKSESKVTELLQPTATLSSAIVPKNKKIVSLKDLFVPLTKCVMKSISFCWAYFTC
ncbi:hypothetical protein XENOCAPTIV_021037 [Xenoophorus captivus]|uniref:Agouti signaling protein n=1 Tax=Xenoophorus captivus TaxID=1517983 RepID=A0ABV0RIE1_9TELE